MDANWWNNALQSYDVGREHRADRENAQAFQDGGYGAVEQAAGRRGDLRTATQMRRFQDEERQQAYQQMETIAPWARNVIRATRNMQPEQARSFLQQNSQRFLDFGLSPEQVSAGIAGLTDADPAVRQEWANTLDQAFSQHQDPEWRLVQTQDGQRAVAIDQGGQVQMGGIIPGGGAGRYATADEVAAAGYRRGSVIWLEPGQPPRVVQAPSAARGQDQGYYPDDGYDYHE